MTHALDRSHGLLLLSLVVAGCGGVDDDDHVGAVTQGIKVCADAGTRKGVDVSYYQGTIDWNAVAADGVDFAVARVNDGAFMDPQFDANWAGIRQAGLVRGAYQYFNPGGDPIEQADVFINKVGELGPGDLPPVLDVESTDGVGPNAISNRVGAWITRVQNALGRQPIIYTGSYFWNDYVQTEAFDNHPLWIAHYQTDCPNMPNAWDDWVFWQHSSSGSVAGIAGAVDVNRFNGHLKALNDLAANGWRAELVSLDHPEQLAAGETAAVEVVLHNLGARTWSDTVVLGTTEPRDRASVFAADDWQSDRRVVAMSDDVLPGDTVTLRFSITAPAEPGRYREHFNLVKEEVAWFSDIVPGGGPSDDAIAVDVVVTEGEGPVDAVEPDDPVEVAPPSVAAGQAEAGCNAGGGSAGDGWWPALALMLLLWRVLLWRVLLWRVQVWRVLLWRVPLSRARRRGQHVRSTRRGLGAFVLLVTLTVISTARSASALSKLECAVKDQTGYTSGNAFPIKVVTADGKLVERNTANAYFFMAHRAANAGVQLRVVSGFRTMAEQQYLYNCYVHCSCNSCNLAAKPGYSNHQSGSALDLNTASPGVYSWLSAHAGSFGFVRTVPSESWHWEYRGDRPVGGPCGTLAAELMEASSDAPADESGEADYRVCAGDDFQLWFDVKDVGTARWADRGMDAHYAGEGVGLEPAAGGIDRLTGLGRVSVNDNVNDNVHPKSWGGTPGGACNDAPKCRRTIFSEQRLSASAPAQPGIYTSEWQLHDRTPADDDVAFGPLMAMSFRVESCDDPVDPDDPDDPRSPDAGGAGSGGATADPSPDHGGCRQAPTSTPASSGWWLLALLMLLRRRRGRVAA